MTSQCTRVERLVSQVQQPARRTGCEDGTIARRTASGKVAWLPAHAGTYEIGLPNQGVQILHEILEQGDDAAHGGRAVIVDLGDDERVGAENPSMDRACPARGDLAANRRAGARRDGERMRKERIDDRRRVHQPRRRRSVSPR